MAKQAFLCKYAEIGIKGKNRYYANRSAGDWQKLMANLPLSESRDVFLWKQMEIMISRMRSMP